MSAEREKPLCPRCGKPADVVASGGDLGDGVRYICPDGHPWGGEPRAKPLPRIELYEQGGGVREAWQIVRVFHLHLCVIGAIRLTLGEAAAHRYIDRLEAT